MGNDGKLVGNDGKLVGNRWEISHRGGKLMGISHRTFFPSSCFPSNFFWFKICNGGGEGGVYKVFI